MGRWRIACYLESGAIAQLICFDDQIAGFQTMLNEVLTGVQHKPCHIANDIVDFMPTAQLCFKAKSLIGYALDKLEHIVVEQSKQTAEQKRRDELSNKFMEMQIKIFEKHLKDSDEADKWKGDEE